MPNRVEFTMELKSVELTKALCWAVEPDNRTAPTGVTVITHQEGTCLISTIENAGRIQTLLATFNDLVAALSAVISVLENI